MIELEGVLAEFVNDQPRDPLEHSNRPAWRADLWRRGRRLLDDIRAEMSVEGDSE